MEFKEALDKILSGQIEYGYNKEYCFSLDEDGYLVLLQRIPDEDRDPDFEPEDLKTWPLNPRDGKVLLELSTGKSRGLDITSMFLDYLKLAYN